MKNKLIIRLSNEVGNQMFMYASAYVFAKKLNREFFYDDETAYQGSSLYNYNLDIFKISSTKAPSNLKFLNKSGYVKRKFLKYLDNFNSFDFKTLKFIDNSQKIIFFDNIDGEDLYNTIINSKKVIAFHGMMTNLASINKHKVLDLFHCNINNWDDYRNYRNSFYEFKPSYKGYDFTIPSKNIQKTLKKIRYSLKK